MNENAKAWVAALRSGQWKQITGTLRSRVTGSDEIGFCCLGVASEVSGKGRWVGPSCFQDEEQEAKDDESEFDHVSEEFASPMVAEWLGLTSEDGTLEINGEQTSLAELNDGGKSFDEIADIIEAHKDQLFKPEPTVDRTAPE